MASSTTNQWKLGLFVLASFVAFVGTGFWLGARRFNRETLDVYTYFEEAVDGLEIGSPIKFLGVQIGSVREIRIAPRPQLVEVRGEIDLGQIRELGLPTDEKGLPIIPPTLRAQLVRSWVTGVAFIQTDYFPADRPVPEYGFPLPDHVVNSVSSSQKTLERGVQEILGRMPELLDQATNAAGSIQRIVDPSTPDSLTARLNKLLDQLDRLLASAEGEGLVAKSGDALEGIRRTLENLDELIGQFSGEQGSYGSTIAELRGFLQDARAKLGAWDTEGTVAAIRNAANELALLTRQTGRTLPGIERAFASLRRLAELLERDPGSILRGRAPTPEPTANGR